MGFAAAALVGLTALAVDRNSNGVSDIYERWYSVDGAQLDSDPDGDGFTCRQEAEFGTDPHNAASLPCAFLVNGSGDVSVSWQSIAGVRYQLESSSDLATWESVGAPITGDGTTVSVPCAAAEGRRFYRVAALESADADGDGLTAYEKGVLGASDHEADSDHDGVSDMDESLWGTNPALGDTDRDGIGDGDELADGGDPTDPSDGFPQNAETRPFVLRMTYFAGWPNYPISPPTIPSIDFTVRDVLTDTIVGHVTDAAADRTGATPLGFFSGKTPDGGTPDPEIVRGREYELKMSYARNPSIWRSGANGRVFSSATINSSGEPINLIIYSTRIDGGSYYISNDVGGVWIESAWQATGIPTNSVANSRQFYVHDTLCPTAKLWAINFDLDLDSDNNNLNELPDQSLAEDDVEETQPKFVTRNSNDDDADGIVDSEDFDNAAENDFVPLVLDVSPASLPYDKITVKFRYDGDPSYVASSTSDLRLWRPNNVKTVRTTDSYIQPERAYTAAELGLASENARVKLFVEALTEVPEPSEIEAVFLFNGVEYFHDKVRVWGGADVALALDANRDGEIKFPFEDASDATSVQKPFRFWINDDIDREVTYTNAEQISDFIASHVSSLGINEVEEDDIDEAKAQAKSWNPKDWMNNRIYAKRDLEDFSRIWLCIRGGSTAFLPKTGSDNSEADLYVGLQWSTVGMVGSPAIKIFQSAESDGGSRFLNDSTGVAAAAQVNFDYAMQDFRDTALPDISGMNVVSGTGIFVVPPRYFGHLNDANPTTFFLFEGVSVGAGQLKMVILRKEGNAFTKIGDGPVVWIDLAEPGNRIKRWTCGDGDLGNVVSFTPNTHIAPPSTDEEKDMVLYIHGYNMKPNEKQRWIETTYKRLWQLGFKGTVGGFTWPCAQSALPFDQSEEKAWQAGGQLRLLLSALKTAGYRVHVLAHSQGNVVMGEALRQAGINSALVSTYIASQAAIPAHCYDKTLPEVDFDPDTPEIYGRYWDGGDQNLPETWPASAPSYLAPSKIQGAAGKFVNYFNPQDYALTGNGLSMLADDGSQPGWMTDQRMKPNVGYWYSNLVGFEEDPLAHIEPQHYKFPDDRFTIFSFCAEARSLALGATSAGGVFAITPSVNLTDGSFGFRNQHVYHSAQFRSFYAARWQYWKQVLQSCDVSVRAQP